MDNNWMREKQNFAQNTRTQSHTKFDMKNLQEKF